MASWRVLTAHRGFGQRDGGSVKSRSHPATRRSQRQDPERRFQRPGRSNEAAFVMESGLSSEFYLPARPLEIHEFTLVTPYPLPA